ncbi:MAG: hypothetical protein ACRCZS_21050 [Chroococcidiopsis sp.]
MTICSDVSQRGTQLLTLSRRGFLRAVTQYVPSVMVATGKNQAVKIPNKYPVPPFSIGDRVASFWPADEFDEDEWDEELEPEIGEIVGICWHPQTREWRYQINWTSGSCEAWAYPCFDEALVDETYLERLS